MNQGNMCNDRCGSSSQNGHWVEEDVCLTPQVIKQWYEFNAETNAFTDLEKSGLAKLLLGGNTTTPPSTGTALTNDEKIALANLVATGVPRNVYSKVDVTGLLSTKVDRVTGQGLSHNDFTDVYKTMLDSGNVGATLTDAQIKSAYENNTNTNAYNDIEKAKVASALQAHQDISNLVLKVVGKQLSTEDYTTAEKAKLATLEGSHFKGTHVDEAALLLAHPTAEPGSYAYVVVHNTDHNFIWDDVNSAWVDTGAAGAVHLTDAQIKTQYENNPDTNVFDDASVTLLSSRGDLKADGSVSMDASYVVTNPGDLTTKSFVDNKLGNMNIISTAITKTVGVGKDFEKFHDAAKWMESCHTIGEGYVTLSLDAGIHLIGEPSDMNQNTWFFYTFDCKCGIEGHDVADTFITMPPIDNGGSSAQVFKFLQEMYLTNFTFDASKNGYPHTKVVDLIQLKDAKGYIEDLIIKDCNIAVSIHSGALTIQTWDKPFTIEDCTTAFDVTERGFLNLDITPGKDITVKNCDKGITVRNHSVCEIPRTPVVFINTTKELNMVINEQQFDGSYITDAKKPLYYKTLHVTSLASITTPGVYSGTNLSDSPIQGKVMVEVYADEDGNLDISLKGADGERHEGGKPVGGVVFWHNTSPDHLTGTTDPLPADGKDGDLYFKTA